MNDQDIIKSGVIEIFRRNGYPDPDRMTQRDFDHIGELLQEKSGILISGTTIKRLAYGEFSRMPQVATLNAIANYFDCKTWQAYRASKFKPEPMLQPEPETKKRKPVLKYLSIPALLIILAGSYILAGNNDSVRGADKATFSFRKNTVNDIPNSVVFNYNIDAVKADSFFIQQSWDANRRVRIYKNTYTLTDIYYEPGYHIAKLIANDSVIRSVDVSIPTDGWFFYAIDNIANYTSEYIRVDSFVHNGKMGLTPAQLAKNNIDTRKDKRYHYLYFPSEMRIPADNFTLSTRVRMQEVRNSLCPYIEIEVYSQRYFTVLRSTTKGCAHEAFLVVGEQIKKGHDTDLSSVCFDVSQWTDIEIAVRNKTVVIKINGQEVFSTRYTKDARNLAGLGFISNGLCEIDHVELAGLDGRVLYRNEF